MPPNKKKGKGKKEPKKGAKKPAVRKPLTLKQKQRKESKVVRADSLNWKPVEIPDNLESYEGLYGIEELDGVDVKYVDGKAEFVVKEEKKDTKKEENENEDKNEIEDEDDEEEFTGFDDPVTETKRPSDEPDLKSKKKQKPNKDDELRENAFVGVDASLPKDTDLPKWSMENVSLSTYTINGLAGCGFKEPTAIQRKAIPLALQGKDVIGKATTGSGKTLAYGIPILERCLAQLESKTNTIKPPTAMIFAPTRELAHQVVDHMNKIAKFSPLAQNGIVSITGGLSIQKQERLLSHGPSILVATPGRCLELMEKSVDLVNRMALTDMIVLDEADRLLQDGHFEEFEKILDMLNKHRPKKTQGVSRRWQTLVFSATFSRDLFGKLSNNKPRNKESSFIENDEILSLLNTKLQFRDRTPAVIDANPKEIVSGKVTEALVECGPSERDLYLYYFLLMYPGSTLVFANAIDSVKRLVPFLTNLNIPTFSIHSSMIQKQRLRALERFKAAGEKNQTAVLIASDVAARGLDIPNIDHVAHYHLPRSADVYVHRSGRTARAGKEGVSVMFCSPQEASGPFRKLRKLVADSANKGSRMNMHSDVKLLPIEMDLVTQLKPRVNISSKLANSTISTVSTKKSDSWMKEAAEELGVDMEEEFVDDHLRKQRLRDDNKILTKDQAASLRAELKSLLNERLRINKRRSYLTSGVDNLAHQMLTGDSHEAVWGHAKVKALDQLKKGKSTKKSK
ncbi:ATP-dependent RNA helicase [Meyerozyma guilliermondii]